MTLTKSIRRIVLLSCLSTCVALTGCEKQYEPIDRSSDFDDFIDLYNSHVAQWLKEQTAATEEAIDKQLAKIEADQKANPDKPDESLQVELESLMADREKWKFRNSLGDYFKFSDPSAIPSDLVWEDGMDEPEIGDPAATKGGVFRRFILSFPPTIRPTGSNSNNSFRGELHDNINMPLVGLHPETMGMIPGLAREWATSKDGRTTYFRIHPEATYSDGTPVKARDFLLSVYIYVSDNIVNPFFKQYFKEEVAQWVVYDDLTLSISLPTAKLYAPGIAGSFTPSHPGFYSEYGPDYEQRYQWRFPPTTGAYEVRDEDIVKGVSITQTRVKNWWAKDMKYYRHRFNPDKILHLVVRDESKAFELFRAGELDTYDITRPELWYQKSEMDPVYKGYIERVTYYTQYPAIPRGLYVNVTKDPVNNRDVRVGIDYSLNWQKIIDIVHRGDPVKLNAFNEGYAKFSDPSIKARPYSIEDARAAFARAGYTEEGKDGILSKPDGTRLSVAVTYTIHPVVENMMAMLREDAKACGLELRLDGLEATVSYLKVVQKQHQMVFTGWIITPPTPVFYQYLHSKNAFDDKGNPKPQTNNVFLWSRPDTDRLSVAVRNATTEQELADAAGKLQNIMHDEAIFLPAYTTDYVRMGSWRWVGWPDCENTRFCPPLVYDPRDSYVYWIDQDKKRETQAARRSGKAFPEVARTVDAYRVITPAAKPKPKLPQPQLPEQPDLPDPETPDAEIPELDPTDSP